MSGTGETLALPSKLEQDQARTTQRKLAQLQHSGQLELHLRTASGDEALELPTSVLALLNRILAEMADGNAVTLVPVHAELTTSQAADLLNVSRPHLVKLLESNAIGFTRVGSHRRIRAEDVLRYRERRLAERREALNALTAESERLGLY